MTARAHLLLGALLLGSGCSCGERSKAADGVDASGGAAAGSTGTGGTIATGGSGGAPDAGDAGSDAAVVCPDDDRPAVVPANWVRFPGMSCDCEDIWVDPDPASAGPVGKWVAHAPGGKRLELKDGTRIHHFAVLGDASVSPARMSFTVANSTSFDTDRVVIDMDSLLARTRIRLAWDGTSSDCNVMVHALNDGLAYVMAWISAAPLRLHTIATGAVPIVRARIEQPGVTQGFIVASDVMAWQLAPNTRIDAVSLADGKLFSPALNKPGTGLYLQAAAGDTIAIMEWGAATREIVFWDPSRGVRTVITPDDGWEVLAFGTDGKDMVWSDGTPRDADAGTRDRVRILTAPFSKDPDPATFRVLREVSDNPAAWRIRDGFAAGKPGDDQLQVIRLSDGHMWEIPDQQGDWTTGVPIYVNSEELLYGVRSISNPDQFWTFVRVPLSELGPGTPAN